MSCFSFKRKERIRKRSEFITIYKKGVKRESQHFIITILPNNKQWSRLGIAVSKKVGKAVVRNHMKRLLREYFRLHKIYLSKSWDMVFTAKLGANKLKYSEICREINKTLSLEMIIPDNAEKQ